MFRFRIVRLVMALCFGGATLCAGQGVSTDRNTNVSILVRVTFENERSAGDQIRVELLTDAGLTVANSFTDTDGRASFHITFPGAFRLEVSGSSVQGTSSTTFHVEDMDKSKTVFVRVKPKADGNSAASKPDTPAVTSAADLRVPSEARKAFRKGIEAWGANDFPKAAEQFEKAVALFPEYDTALNNLGVMYIRMNQPEKARAAFERSVALNDKNADADRNLARVLLDEGNFARAEELLKKSLVVEPLNPVTLTLLCAAEAETGDDDAALATARKVHQLPHEGYPLVHYVAGQTLEHQGRTQEAYVEYETYLHEAPSGAEAPQVRSALARLTAVNRQSPQ